MNTVLNSRLYKIPLLLAIMVTAGGCWDNQELDTISIVTGIGIDASRQQEVTQFTFQVGKMSKTQSNQQSSTDQGSPLIVLESTKKGILAAIDSLRHGSSRNLFLHHNQVIIFGREQAEKGIKPFLDAFLRENEMRMEVWIVVAEKEAKEILSAESEEEELTGVSLNLIMENERLVSEQMVISLLRFTSRFIEETSAPVAPMITLIKNGKAMQIDFAGMAVFRDDKLAGVLDKTQTRGFAWMMGDLHEFQLEVETEHGYADLRLFDISSKMKPVLLQNNKPAVSFEIQSNMSIGEVEGFEDVEPAQIYAILEQAAVRKIEEEIRDSFQILQRWKTDAIGLGTAFYRYHPKQWETMKGNWPELYAEADLNLHVEAKLRDTGKINDFLR